MVTCMDSGTNGDFDGDYLNSRINVPKTVNVKVYARRVHKKAHRTGSNDNKATPVSVSSENPNIVPATVSSTGTEVVTASHSREHSNSAVASISQPINGNPASTAEIKSDYILNACVDVSATEDVSSGPLKVLTEPVIRESSAVEAEDSLLPKKSVQLVGRLPHEEQSSFLAGDNASTQNRLQADPANQALEPLMIKRASSPLDDEEVQYSMEKRSSCIDHEQLRTNGIDPQNLTESYPLCTADNFPNGGEKAPTQLPRENQVGDDLRSEEIIPAASKLSENKFAAVTGEVEPMESLTVTRVEDKVIFSFSKATKKDDIEELGQKLKSELDRVRKLSDQLEAKELQLASFSTQVSNRDLNNLNSDVNVAGYFPPQTLVVQNNIVERKELMRINSEVSGIGHRASVPMKFGRMHSDVGIRKNLEPRSYSRQLSVALMESSHDAGEIIDKEKRTPKANQYYRNSEFLLGKDKLPPDSNKKLKKMNGKKHARQTEQEHGFGLDKNKNQALKSCSGLLQRLMKHKHSWVFNEPVDAKALGLHDYHVIIKHPMDFGTIKSRLSQNWYKSPREFAEDVRLVFTNAMIYNPKGQDVHIMAEELSGVFEEKWAAIETKYNPYLKYHVYQDAELPIPTSRNFPPLPLGTLASGPVSSIHSSTPARASTQSLITSAPTSTTNILMATESKIQRPHVGRMPALKKPKAKDPNKRDMTYDEKQRLSTNLQILASEKLDAIVQIIKKNDTALSQHDDEIEVDIDSVDPETLWELDRFVTNYKKGLSKKKRKAELALQARTLSNQSVPPMNPTSAVREVQNKIETDKSVSLAVEDEKINISRSSSSSSSSSDSESTSSGSESDNSSADGSGAG